MATDSKFWPVVGSTVADKFRPLGVASDPAAAAVSTVNGAGD